jgi:hypothetical protein
LHGTSSLKLRRDDDNAEMPAAALGAFMPGVTVTVIAHFDFPGRKGLAQAVFNERYTFHLKIIVFTAKAQRAQSFFS